MPTIAITKSYVDGSTLFESDLDNIKDGIETFINVTGIDADNLQDSAVSTAKLADSAVTTSKIASDAVTTVKILDGAITSAKILDEAITSIKIPPDAVTTVKIPDAAITTAKIATAAITQAKVAVRTSASSTATVGNVAVSGTVSGTFTSTSDMDVGLDVTITTLGNPVMITLQPEGSSPTIILNDPTAPFGKGTLKIIRTTSAVDTTVAQFQVTQGNFGDGGHAPSEFSFIDLSAAAGTHTYTIKVSRTADATSVQLTGCYLVAYEGV